MLEALTVSLPGLIGAVFVPQPEIPAVQVGDAVRRALVATGIPFKEAAARMGISEPELSRQLTHRGPNLARLVMLGPVFLGHLMASLGIQTRTEERLSRLERAIERMERSA